MRLTLNLNSLADYQRFLRIKSLPQYRFEGREAIFPDEYASLVGIDGSERKEASYRPIRGLFDYQRDIVKLALRKRKFAVFAECGLGKTLVLTEYARTVRQALAAGKRILIVSPLMVVKQTLAEVQQFYGSRLAIEQVKAADLGSWLKGTGGIGITNYDALTEDLDQGNLGALILDESSMLKSHYGKWGMTCIRLGRGLDWKLALTGTPAPNDRIEYANHAVFLDAFPTVNAFLAKYFANRGETCNRWELKPHALAPFYRSLSHWCIFLANPSVYGWKDNVGNVPPIHVHIHDVDLTDAQRDAVRTETRDLFGSDIGGIGSRAKLGQLAKGHYNGEAIGTNKPAYVRELVRSWEDTESTLIWCLYNAEQDSLVRLFPDAGNIAGDTPMEDRERIIDAFKAGKIKTVVSKPKVLGFGLNLQIATRQVFSGLQDSYESYWQAVKRSNRIGSTKPLNVHIPVTDVELPMVETVLRKAKRVQQDTEEQERIFKQYAVIGLENKI